ncbi:hypothetical protein D3C86_1679370 [compost metagenome]
MPKYRFGYILEVGSYSPRPPEFPELIEVDTPEEAAKVAKDLYAANPFSLMGCPPLAATRILLTTSEPHFAGFTFDYNTLERI